jgi:tetratricopeptide (TPR) repeat protein
LVGRERELEVLRGAYAGAAAGRVTVAHVVGESGVGKSTLCAAFLQELRETQPAVVLSGRCYERESVPYKAFDRLVDELSRHLQQLPAVDAAALMPRAISALARVFPVLERVACVASAPLPTTGDEHELRLQAFGAFVELLARIRDRRPLVLYLDDMQWSDRDSALLLERLFAGAGAPRVLLIVCQRGTMHEGNAALAQALRALREQPGMTFVELPLSPLPLPAATALARKLLRDEVRAAEVAREAGGNPFFVGELCRYVLEAAAHGERPLVALEHALERRMARTSAAATRLLALLAISGRPTPVPVLAAACRDGVGALLEVDVHGELHVLRGAQLVRASSERGYECYHDRIRVALAERVPTAEQAELHLSLARAWEIGGEADPEVLFEHRLAGGQRERAAEHALAAASKAFAGLAFERSAALYRQAIALLPAGAVQGRDLEERLGDALSRAGRWAESGEAFARAATYGGARAGYLEQQAALHLLGSGRYDQGIPRLQRAFRLLGLSWPRTSWGSAIGAALRLLWLRVAGERALRRKLVPLSTPPTQAEALPLEVLLTAASLVPPYDMMRGLYLLTVFVLRGLRSRAPDDVAFALGMLSTVMATWSPMRGFAQRLADRALELLNQQPELGDDVAAGLLGLIGFARVLDFRMADALALGAQGSERLRRSNRAYAFHAWGARSVQCFALTVMGRMGEAAKLFAATEQEARELGDELAAVAGSSVLRYLVDDDVPRAEQLIAHKLAFLARVPSSGLLHPMVSIERVTLALYTGRGGDVMHLVPAVSQAGMMQLQPLALSVACALQAIDQYGRDPALIKLVKRARTRVPKRRDDATAGLRAQIDACIAGLEGKRTQAIADFERAIRHYDHAGMGLHAAGMRLRCGELRGDDAGRELAAQAARFMRSQGIVNVEAWGMFLAPGLGHLRGVSRSSSP